VTTSYRERTATDGGALVSHAGAASTPPGTDSRASLGDLITEITDDVSQLVRDEIELAKAELKQEAAKAGKAAGMLGGAGYAGHLVMLLASFAAVFGLWHVIDLAWAALVITAVWAVIGAVLYVRGRERLRTVNLKPEQTMKTVKEDAQWARHPTS
jgi:uncharacterized membrane protein YgcG